MAQSSKSFGFFQALPKSFWGHELYATVTQKTFWRRFWQLLAFHFVIALIFVLVKGIPVVTDPDIPNGADAISQLYPNELELTIEDGTLSSNVEEPYVLEFKDWQLQPTEIETDQDSEHGEWFENLVVIDTTQEFSLEQMRAYDTWAWINEEAVYMLENNNSSNLNVVPYADFELTEKIVINQELVDDFAGVAWKWVKNIAFFAAPLFFIIGVGGLFSFHLGYLLFLGLLIWGISAWTFKFKSITFEEAYKIGMIAFMPAMTIRLLFVLTGPLTGFYGFAWMTTLLALLFAVINLQQAKAAKAIK